MVWTNKPHLLVNCMRVTKPNQAEEDKIHDALDPWIPVVPKIKVLDFSIWIMLNAAVVYSVFANAPSLWILNALARLKWTLIVSGTNQTSPATNLRWNRHRPAFLPHPSWFAVGGIICLLPLVHTIYSWRGRLQIYALCQPHEKYLLCIFTCNWTLWRIRAMRSSKLKEVIKMVPHINTLVIHECCQSCNINGEKGGWRVPQLVHTIQNMVHRAWASESYFFMPCHVNLPCSWASVPENRTIGTQGTPLDEGKNYCLKNVLRKIKKRFACHSNASSWTE